jgi:hypothetical protein
VLSQKSSISDPEGFSTECPIIHCFEILICANSLRSFRALSCRPFHILEYDCSLSQKHLHYHPSLLRFQTAVKLQLVIPTCYGCILTCLFRIYIADSNSNKTIVTRVAMKIALFLCLASCRIWQQHLLPFSAKHGFVTRFQRFTNSDLSCFNSNAKYPPFSSAFVNQFSVCSQSITG